MGGGLMQLVAYGAQDIYLTGNPQITFFKVVYRRHTNFSIEAILQTFDGSLSTTGGLRTSTISRNGDLVYRLWLECELKSPGITRTDPIRGDTYTNWTNNTGHALIDYCEIEIGGQTMDKHTGHWLDIWNELTDHEESEWIGLNKHFAKNTYLRSGSLGSMNLPLKLYVPLKFWFCRNPGLALPLIALQYHEVKFNIKTRGGHALVNSDDIVTLSPAADSIKVQLWADYIFLDTDERRRFAQVTHEYLIEQLQYTSKNDLTTDVKLLLDFNHPVKEVIWVLPQTRSQDSGTVGSMSPLDATILPGPTIPTNFISMNDYFNYNASGSKDATENIYGVKSYEGFKTAVLKLNGRERFKERSASYFRLCQPGQAEHKIPTKHIYCYSFALQPEEHQPSGTCNFSRVDNVYLELNSVNDYGNVKLNVYVINYNVLRIMSGMAGIAYSN